VEGGFFDGQTMVRSREWHLDARRIRRSDGLLPKDRRRRDDNRRRARRTNPKGGFAPEGSLICKACRFARGVSVVVAVVLVCLVVCLTFISLTAIGSQEDPSALAMANVLPLDHQGANRDVPPLDGTYPPFAPFTLADEADEGPVNCGLLTILLLATPFFGASVGWLLTNAQRQGALCFSCVGVVGEVLGRAREEYLPFLGVFRL
jgi:hypothetical protein